MKTALTKLLKVASSTPELHPHLPRLLKEARAILKESKGLSKKEFLERMKGKGKGKDKKEEKDEKKTDEKKGGKDGKGNGKLTKEEFLARMQAGRKKKS